MRRVSADSCLCSFTTFTSTDGMNPTGITRLWSTKGNFSGVLLTSFLIHNDVKTVPPSCTKKCPAYS